MLKLCTLNHAMLSDRVVEVLKEKNIVTVSEFLHTDSNKLKQLLNIDLIDLGTLKKDLWSILGILPINGLQHYNILINQSNYIPTGIKSLDELLGGGVLSGGLIDICGLSGSGKTQLYTTIAVNWATNDDIHTFVVDTKGDFSGDRINRILLSRDELGADKRKHIMRNIKVEKCNSPFKLIALMRRLLDQMSSHPKVKLLVIDSLPTLWFLFHGNKRSLNQRNLAILADLLRKLAVEYSIAVITINIETRTTFVGFGCAGDKSAIDDANQNEMDLMNQTESPKTTSALLPALGKHWNSICSLRLRIERKLDSTNSKSIFTTTEPSNERIIRILKSNQNQTDIHCMVHLTNTGIT
ncbi:DNA repair protein RAD51 homolog 4-like [Sitodiplosis mosellana]|uniref:DNA repair protein RAD51 homolog 4-like n=1 Tax=Sitodiplosis mosellana TaxID=263140 RepID=UPI0024452CB6|nr:DNA repair protein RAD51 homolog 4-like [Sitodiplosis mosellana]